MTCNDDIIKKIDTTKKVSQATLILDLYALNLYSTSQNMSLEELVDEADDDEENIKKLRRRRIKKHLDSFIEYLQEDRHKHNHGIGFSPQSIHGIISRIKAFYSYYEIQLPKIYLPEIPDTERSTDLPTIPEIKHLLENTSEIKHRAVVKTMLSSGLSSNEISKLTKEQFRVATYSYHQKDNLTDAIIRLKELIQENESIIPTWELTRGKTNHSFITFNSPEATRDIVEFIDTKSHPDDSRLFELTVKSVRNVYLRIDKRNSMGFTADGHHRFRSHAMRKVFATTLGWAEINGIPLDSLFVEFLLGHKLPRSMEPYYKNRPKRLKKIYLQVVNKLSIENVNVLDIKSPEYLELEKENKDMRKNIESIVEEAMLKHDQELRRERNDMSIDDLFKDF